MIEVLGVGHAIIDKVISFDEKDEIMQRILRYKGRFFKATAEEHFYLRQKQTESFCAGGSAANTIRDLAQMGMKTGFWGKVGQDKEALFFEKSLSIKNLVSFLLQTDQDITGCSVVIVHEDKDRTQCARACAGNLLDWAEFDVSLFEQIKAILTEGYLLNQRPDFVISLIKQAKKAGKQVYFTLSDVHCVEAKKKELFDLMPQIDILFGNEYEFDALSLSRSLLPALCLATKGSKGVDVYYQKKWHQFDTPACLDIVNTNGAGDAFAAGFLFEWHRQQPIDVCIQTAHKTASRILKTPFSYLLPENI